MGRPLTLNMHLAAWQSPFSLHPSLLNLRGIVVLLALLLISSSAEKIIFVASKEKWIIWKAAEYFLLLKGGDLSDYIMFCGFFIQFTAILISYILEKYAAAGWKVVPFMAINVVFLTVAPVVYIWTMKTHVLFNCIYILNVCIVWFKLISYHHVLNDVRYHIFQARKFSKKTEN